MPLRARADSCGFHTHFCSPPFPLQLKLDNTGLEKEVGELSARSKAVAAASEARLAQLRSAADAARAVLKEEEAAVA